MADAMRPWILSEVNYGTVKDNPYEVAVLPFGATEPHNLHLPYGTDCFEATEIGSRACEAAFYKGARVVLLPTIPYGTETNLARFPLAMNLNPSTLLAVVRDLLKSLEHSGIRKLLLLNSHGGNDLKPMLRELMGETTVQLFLCDWFRGLTADVQKSLFKEPGDHAGALETAFGLAFFPHLVHRNEQTGKLHADAGAVRSSRFSAINRGWVSISRPWHLLTSNTGSGNPHEATAEQGKRLMETIVERLGGFLVELASSPIDGTFPMVPSD